MLIMSMIYNLTATGSMTFSLNLVRQSAHMEPGSGLSTRQCVML